MASSKSRGSLLGLLLLVVLLTAGGRALWLWLDRPIQRVSIRAEMDYVSADYLREAIAPLVRQQTWLSIDLNELRNQVRAIEWLSEVRVSRRWPDMLIFELHEEEPLARWNDEFFINSKGQPFRRDGVTVSDDLPDLAGPDGSGAEVLSFLDRLRDELALLDLEVTQLRLEDRGAWRFQVNEGLWVVLGRNEHDIRMTRFKVAWQKKLNARMSRIRYIDLRYPNGLVVAWHGETNANISSY